MYCCTKENDSKISACKGIESNEKMFDFLIQNENPVVYFHHLFYDGSFMEKLDVCRKVILRSWVKKLRMIIRWKGTYI